MASRLARLTQPVVLIFLVFAMAVPVLGAGRRDPAPPKTEHITFEQLVGTGKIPEGINREKARVVLQVIQDLVARIKNETIVYGHENAVSDLKALKIDVPKYLDFYYAAFMKFLKRFPGAVPKTFIHRLLSETLFLFRYFPGAFSVSVLDKLLANPETDQHHKVLIVETLPGAGGPSSAGILARCLNSKEERIRVLAKLQFISLHQEYPDAEIGTPVLEILKSINSPMYAKNEAILILSILNDKRMVAPLVRNMLFYDEKTAVNGIRALGLFKDDRSKAASLPVLKQALASGITVEHRRWAAISLGLLDDWDAIPSLIDRLKDKNEKVRKASHDALCKLTKRKLAANPAIWKSWYEIEGKSGRPEPAPESGGAGEPVRFTGIQERKTERAPIRPTPIGSIATDRNVSQPPPGDSAATSTPATRSRNIILIILACVLALSIIAIFLFFRRGQGKKEAPKQRSKIYHY